MTASFPSSPAALAGLDPERMPRHVAIIMDGNGRWAQGRGLPRVAGHKAGVDAVRTIVRASGELGIEALTLYAFSTENWLRPKAEVDELMRILCWALRGEVLELAKSNVRLRTIGRTADLAQDVQDELRRACDALKDNTGLTLTLALNYGGRAEIVDAVNKVLQQRPLSPSQSMDPSPLMRARTIECPPDTVRPKGGGSEIASPSPFGGRDEGRGVVVTETDISAALYTAGLPDPDLVIRTSGEMRLSNFLLWQVAYAEIYVTPVFWPDFGRDALIEAVRSFQSRGRRFGGA